jgi:hypothetical protein
MINKRLVFGVLFLTSTCLYAATTEKKFEDLKKEYKDKKELVDITITDAATADFFTDKTLKNITFKGKVTGNWKDVSFDGIIIFSVLPEGSINKEISATDKERSITFALADGVALKVAKVDNVYKWQKS